MESLKKITVGAFYSWEIFSENLICKTIDKSVFKSKKTGIPKETKFFWGVENLKIGDQKQIQILYDDLVFEAYIDIDRFQRASLRWKKDLEKILNEKFPNSEEKFRNKIYDKENAPMIRFEKIDYSNYKIEFIYESFEEKVEPKLIIDDNNLLFEGNISYTISKKYERNPQNRKKAIIYHGTSCKICGFNFEKVYGEIGKGYIEIHHKIPLSEVREEMEVNPKTDLIPLCANCHRMIHRNKSKAKSIDEIKLLKN